MKVSLTKTWFRIIFAKIGSAKIMRVLIFGRETPVELDFLQVAKL